ncbi:MAG: PIG-L deacetylase family protein [Thermoguttaceae bacterium]
MKSHATSSDIQIDRRNGESVVSGPPESVFPDWQGDQERWLFVAPHDDDIVLGCGLTFACATSANIKTWAAVVTTGEVGYCHREQRHTIAGTRQKECADSFKLLGLCDENLIRLGYPDGGLRHFAGFRIAENGTKNSGPAPIAETTGLQSSFTWLLRKVVPTRLFVPSVTDLHPDHRAVSEDMMISIFHAYGGIWPELGEKLPAIPAIYEYATYSDFLTPPTIRVRSTQEMLERKLVAIEAYRSQEQIGMVVDVQRKTGAKEFLREVRFDIFRPELCDALFNGVQKPRVCFTS